MAKKIPGAQIKNSASGQSPVSELTPNRTVLVQEVNPKRAKAAKSVEVVDVPNLACAVAAFEPEIDFELKETQFRNGSVELANVTCTMRYGIDDPAQIIADFAPEALVGKVLYASACDNEGGLASRPLLRQRVQLLALDQLLSGLNDPEFAAAINDPQQLKMILDAIDSHIDKTKAGIQQAEVNSLEERD